MCFNWYLYQLNILIRQYLGTTAKNINEDHYDIMITKLVIVTTLLSFLWNSKLK
jgi:hypothetical protein